MAIHPNTASMLKESTKEILFVADYCIKYWKNYSWGDNQIGGCLGYPATIMLFSIVDTIGSFYEGNKEFTINIDGADKTIDSDGYQHFFILNSDYYNQQLTEEQIKVIYQKFRNKLMHNLALPPDHSLSIGQEKTEPFTFITNETPQINLVPFLKISKLAGEKFLEVVDEIVPNSRQGTKLNSI